MVCAQPGSKQERLIPLRRHKETQAFNLILRWYVRKGIITYGSYEENIKTYPLYCDEGKCQFRGN
jgi:hypothetical protein